MKSHINLISSFIFCVKISRLLKIGTYWITGLLNYFIPNYSNPSLSCNPIQFYFDL